MIIIYLNKTFYFFKLLIFLYLISFIFLLFFVHIILLLFFILLILLVYMENVINIEKISFRLFEIYCCFQTIKQQFNHLIKFKTNYGYKINYIITYYLIIII